MHTLPDRPWNGLWALDAFCNIGGSGMGLYLAGFNVVGVDILPQPNYPFEFHQADAIDYITTNGADYDLTSAGPPCQYDCMLTAGTNQARRDQYPDLLEPTRTALDSTGRPYIIEQPPGRASKRMRIDATLCGEMFDLRVLRHRNFELGRWSMQQPEHVPHRGLTIGYRHGRYVSPDEGRYFQVYGNGGGKGTVPQWQDAMGIHWTGDRRELAEAIPPAYFELLGRRAAAHIAAARQAVAALRPRTPVVR